MTFVNKITLILADSFIKNQNALYMFTSNQIEVLSQKELTVLQNNYRSYTHLKATTNSSYPNR